MESRLPYQMLRQPDDTTCGPTCLHSVYRFYGVEIPLEQIIREVGSLTEGGTYAVCLGCHALRNGFDARIETVNLQFFDPTWFRPLSPPLEERLRAQMEIKQTPKFVSASQTYLEFLELGGEIRMESPSANLIRKYLKRGRPILTGLSATWLYREARERTVFTSDGRPRSVLDDIGGYPQGHFVVLCGYDSEERQVLVADPLAPNALAKDHLYHVDLDRVISAILLGILTYDANLLVIQPRKKQRRLVSIDRDPGAPLTL